MMPPVNWTVMRNVVIFLAWTFTSFLCHFCGKAFLLVTAKIWLSNNDDLWRNLGYAASLTFVQIALCYMSVDVKHTKDGSSLNIARLTHVLATFCTNLSMTFMFASSTLAVKLMEPISSAVTQFFVLRTPMSPITILSLPIIVEGAIIFAGNPLSDMKLSLGFGAAFVSNFILAFRNLAIKKLNTGDQNPLKLKMQTSQLLALSSVLLGVSITLLYLEKLEYLQPRTSYAIIVCFLSGVFHVAYSYLSTGLVLSQLSVVSHAVANIMKRVLVVLLLYLVGKRLATVYNFLGLIVCTLGLFLYTWDKQRSMPRKALVPAEWLNKIYKIRWTYLVFTTCCLVSVWCAVQVFPVKRITNYKNVTFFQRFLEQQQYFINSAQEPASLQDEDKEFLTSDSFLDFTFGPDSSKRPTEGQLAPRLYDYLANGSDEIETFVQSRLLDNPQNANFLSQQLRTHIEVIKEAQRIHYNMFEDVIGKFKYCMLLDTADFENKGDPAITIGEVYFITRLGLEIIYYCNDLQCTDDVIATAVSIARTYSPTELIILLHGGGNVNAYFHHDIFRGEIFQKFQGFKFFIFPQSILVLKSVTPHFEKCIHYYCCNENVTFVLRDHLSYSEARKYFNGTSRLLVAPDMAFHIGPVKRFLSPVFDILWIKRNDSEHPDYRNKFPKHPPHLRLHVSDWSMFKTPKAGTSLEKSFYATVMGLFFTQRGRVVVTDRIHGHIFATLLNIPHVLLDNEVKKLSSYHNTWTRGLLNTRLTDNPEEAMKLALELLELYGDEIPPRAPFLNVSEFFEKIDYSVPANNFP